MRNLFDQFKEPENRLTHALLSCLHEDSGLLRAFIAWATGEPAPSGVLTVSEQSLPGKEAHQELTEKQRRGLPDGWIYNDRGWALLLESKIECPLTADQLHRHRFTAQRRGFPSPHLLALTVQPLPPVGFESSLKSKQWTELYLWLRAQSAASPWANRLYEYMNVLEEKLVTEEYLKSGTLTVFSGIPFTPENTYNYAEAKRLLRLAIEELRMREDLGQLRVDRHALGRAAITGKDSGSVWDFLRLTDAANADNHTEFPHLTLGIHRDFLNVIVTVPNGLRNSFRKNLLGDGLESFKQVFADILTNFRQSLGAIPGAVPWVEVIQRRYPTQRSEPFINALLEFDLRTAFPLPGERTPKLQPQWLSSVYDALTDKNADLQLAAGVRFVYSRCPDAASRAILNHIAHAWLCCAPLLNTLIPPGQ